jgi:hypothetical protein
MLAAGELLQQACSTEYLAAALPDPAAVTAIASALVNFTKRSAAFIQAAGAIGAQDTKQCNEAYAAADAQSGAGLLAAPAADSFELAALCFPAAAPALMGVVCSIADSLQRAVQQWGREPQQQVRSPEQHNAVAGSTRSSSSQSRASAALLVVLLARSAVVLADAMEAAAAAAGSTPAALMAR